MPRRKISAQLSSFSCQDYRTKSCEKNPEPFSNIELRNSSEWRFLELGYIFARGHKPDERSKTLGLAQAAHLFTSMDGDRFRSSVRILVYFRNRIHVLGHADAHPSGTTSASEARRPVH